MRELRLFLLLTLVGVAAAFSEPPSEPPVEYMRSLLYCGPSRAIRLQEGPRGFAFVMAGVTGREVVDSRTGCGGCVGGSGDVLGPRKAYDRTGRAWPFRVRAGGPYVGWLPRSLFNDWHGRAKEHGLFSSRSGGRRDATLELDLGNTLVHQRITEDDHLWLIDRLAFELEQVVIGDRVREAWVVLRFEYLATLELEALGVLLPPVGASGS